MTLSLEQISALFDELISYQQDKVLKHARQFYPGITPEDIRNPQDFPKLMQDMNFHFEDGILSGYVSAKMALLAKVKKTTSDR